MSYAQNGCRAFLDFQYDMDEYPRKQNIWKYKTTAANKIIKGATVVAIAADMPRNEAEMRAEIA